MVASETSLVSWCNSRRKSFCFLLFLGSRICHHTLSPSYYCLKGNRKHNSKGYFWLYQTKLNLIRFAFWCFYIYICFRISRVFNQDTWGLINKEPTMGANQNRIDWLPAEAAAVASGYLVGINQRAKGYLVFRVQSPSCVSVCALLHNASPTHHPTFGWHSP